MPMITVRPRQGFKHSDQIIFRQSLEPRDMGGSKGRGGETEG